MHATITSHTLSPPTPLPHIPMYKTTSTILPSSPQPHLRSLMEPSHASKTSIRSLLHSPTAAADGKYTRWTPTKEQIAMLGGLYRQGLRKPTAEQIQQIMQWLRQRQHGHIEAKNVFYWFKNRRSRERRSQTELRRQQSSPLPTLGQPLASPHLIFSPLLPQPAACSNGDGRLPQWTACGNVIYCPVCYLRKPQAIAEYVANYQQQPRPVLPLPTCTWDAAPNAGSCHTATLTPYGAATAANNSSREILQLFPLQPTFALSKERRSKCSSLASPVSASSSAKSAASEEEGFGEN